jgi:hypothetical protein
MVRAARRGHLCHFGVDTAANEDVVDLGER